MRFVTKLFVASIVALPAAAFAGPQGHGAGITAHTAHPPTHASTHLTTTSHDSRHAALTQSGHGNPHGTAARTAHMSTHGPVSTTSHGSAHPTTTTHGNSHKKTTDATTGAGSSTTTSTGSTTGTQTTNPIARKIGAKPELSSKVEKMLPPGTTLETASAGFKNQGQFLAALHVSQNLNIPFTDLKAAMLGTPAAGTTPAPLSLGQAIHKLRPSADATGATTEAQTQASHDVAATSSPTSTATTTTKTGRR